MAIGSLSLPTSRRVGATSTLDLPPSALDTFVILLALLNGATAIEHVLDMAGVTAPVPMVLWLAIYGYALVALFWHYNISWVPWLARRSPLLTVILVVVAASAFWSINPSLTIQRSVHLIGSSLTAVYFGYRFGPQYLFRILSWLFTILVVGSIIMATLFPAYGQQFYEGAYVWSGLHEEKNALSLTCALAAVLFGLGLLTGRLPWAWCVVMIVLSLLTLMKANSATALLALMAGVTIIATFYSSTRLRLQPSAALAFLIVLGSAFALVTAVVPMEELTGTVGRSTSLTGRTELWAATWQLILDKPWLGHGFGAIWFPRPGEELMQASLLRISWPASHAHNAFLHVAAELGIPIACLAILFLLGSVAKAVYLYAGHASLFVLFGLVLEAMFVVSNLSEVRIFLDRNLHWMLFVAITIGLQRAVDRRAGQRSMAGP